MELPHFHVLQLNPGTGSHTNAITCVDVSIGGRGKDTTGTAGSQYSGLGFEVNDFTGFNFDCSTTYDGTVFVFNQIQGIPLGKYLSLVLNVLLVQAVQQSVAGTVSCSRGTGRLLTTEILGLTAERTLINSAVFKA